MRLLSEQFLAQSGLSTHAMCIEQCVDVCGSHPHLHTLIVFNHLHPTYKIQGQLLDGPSWGNAATVPLQWPCLLPATG